MSTMSTAGEAVHPTPGTYAKIAAVLVAVTALEVGIFYVEAFQDLLIPVFIMLSLLKFVLVAMFYMHLRFDSRLFTGFFAGGLLLATALTLALMALAGAGGGTTGVEAGQDGVVDGDGDPGDGVVDANVTHRVRAVGDNLRFDTDAMTAAAGTEVVLSFENPATTQQHNWVLVENGSKDDVANAAVMAGPTQGWVPDDPRVIAHTGLLGPGGSETLTFTAPGPGTYQFLCTFPGHGTAMFGSFEVLSP